eukprot:1087488-Alexandrium_andersonii.AAC.1
MAPNKQFVGCEFHFYPAVRVCSMGFRQVIFVRSAPLVQLLSADGGPTVMDDVFELLRTGDPAKINALITKLGNQN